MFQLVTFIILLNEIFLYSSAPLTPMAAPRPLAGGRYEMNSSLIRNNNNKNTHAARLPLTLASLAATAASPGRLCALRPRPGAAPREKADSGAGLGHTRLPGASRISRPSPLGVSLPNAAAPALPESEAPLFRIRGTLPVFHPSVCVCPSGPLAVCLCQSLFLPLLSFCLCPLKRSSLCILLFPSFSNHFGFLSGFSFFHLFSLYLSSLHFFCFFLFRPEAIWDGVGSFGNGIDRA